MENLFSGKAIKLLKPHIDYTLLILDVANGKVKSGNGRELIFGDDYILVEDNTDEMVRIYDSHDILIHEFEIKS